MAMTGKCTNIGNCDKADRKDLITVADGLDLVCPDCGKPLMVTGSGGGGSGVGKIIAAVVGILVLLAWFLWPHTKQATQPSQSTAPTAPSTLVPPPPPSQTRNVILRIHGSNTMGSQL